MVWYPTQTERASVCGSKTDWKCYECVQSRPVLRVKWDLKLEKLIKEEGRLKTALLLLRYKAWYDVFRVSFQLNLFAEEEFYLCWRKDNSGKGNEHRTFGRWLWSSFKCWNYFGYLKVGHRWVLLLQSQRTDRPSWWVSLEE